MKQQQRKLLQSIEENYNNETYLSETNNQSNGLYVSQSSTPQQLFLERLINIYVLRKKQYNKIDQQRIQKLITQYKGGFTDLLLTLRYMSYCMQSKIQVSYDKFGMLKLLTNWMDAFQRCKNSKKVNLSSSVFMAIHPENHTISTVDELIVYINYIAVDLQSLLERIVPATDKATNQSISDIQIHPSSVTTFTYEHLDVQDILNFLNNILPKTLFNIVIPEYYISGQPATCMNPADQRQKDFLYSFKSLEYIAKQKNHYQHLLKVLMFTLLKFDLTQPQQKILMTIAMKHFYIFNRDKLQEPFSIFVKIFEKITDAVRFALSDQFILFFKIIKKLGHSKFIKFLREKYEWVQNLLKKIDPLAIVGHPKDNLNAFHGLSIMQHIHLTPGTITQRFIQILQPYSIFYFFVGIKNLDINIRLFYLGPFTTPMQKKQLLINKQKCQMQFKGNIIAIQKGIYMFEFDNTYSWMKGKSIMYETVVLTPIQITKNSQEKQKFIPVLFNKYEMNYCQETIDSSEIAQIKMGMNSEVMKLQKQGKSSEQHAVIIENKESNPKANIKYDVENKIFNLQIDFHKRVYEYETQSSQLFLAKIKTISQQNSEYMTEWYINEDKQIKDLSLLNKWCLNPLDDSLFSIFNQQNRVNQYGITSQEENNVQQHVEKKQNIIIQVETKTENPVNHENKEQQTTVQHTNQITTQPQYEQINVEQSHSSNPKVQTQESNQYSKQQNETLTNEQIPKLQNEIFQKNQSEKLQNKIKEKPIQNKEEQNNSQQAS